MVRSGKHGLVTGLDGALIAVMLVLVVGTGLVLVVSMPDWWYWCLQVLDVRNVPEWSYRTWTGVVGSLLGILVLIRFWPPRKGRSKNKLP